MIRKLEMFVIAVGLAIVAALCTVAKAGDGETTTIVINEDGFSQKDGFWWKEGLPYSRTQVSSGGGWYRDSYGYSYYRQPTYSWSYNRVALVKQTYATPAKAKAPAYGPDWQVEMLKYARARDDYAAYLKALEALGLQGQQYSFQQGSYLSGSVGGYGANGNSLYGYSYHQIQTAYGDLNLNALYQQQGRLTQGAQSLAAQAHTEHSQLVGQAGDNQARIAEILAKAQAARTVLEGVNPQPRVTTDTRIRGSGSFPPGSGKPMQPPVPDPPEETGVKDATEFLNSVAIPKCATCHSGNQTKGGFDVLKYPQMTAEQKAKVWARLTTADVEKRMPRKGKADDSSPGDALTAAELKAFLAN